MSLKCEQYVRMLNLQHNPPPEKKKLRWIVQLWYVRTPKDTNTNTNTQSQY